MTFRSLFGNAVPDDHLDVQIATEQSLGRLTRMIPRNTIRKLVKRIARSRLQSNDATTIDRPDEPISLQDAHSDNDDLSIQKQPHYSGTDMVDDDIGCSNLLQIPSMQNLGMIGSDRESIRTFSSQVANNFQKYVELEDRGGVHFRVLVQFDTGASSSFITRGRLNRIGTHKEYDIPEEHLATFRSPIDADVKTTPTRCIFVKMWNGEIDFFDHNVKLKIIEVPEECPIIIGRNLMAKHNREPSLLTRLELSENNIPEDESFPEIIAPLFKDRKSKKQRIIHNEIDEEHRRQTRLDFLKRQMALESSRSGPADAPLAQWYGHSATSPSAESDWRTQHTAPPFSQQTTAHNSAGVPDNGAEWGIKRADTADTTSTQYTQYTDYSMGGQSSTSSVSNWSYGTSVAPQAWKPEEPAAPETDSMGETGQENSPGRVQ